MKTISATIFLSLFSLSSFSQNNINPQQQANPPAQTNIYLLANNKNVINDDVQEINDNVNEPKQQSDNNDCPDCEKIKQIKSQQSNSSYSYQPQRKQKKQFGKKTYHRFSKKMKKVFGKSKKSKTNYSCFNW